MPNPGTLITLEGIDGSGKGTQAQFLIDRLQEEGFPLTLFSFPRYGNPSARHVEQYLNKELGALHDVDVYTASCLFAMDRFHAKTEMQTALDAGHLVICDRYVLSNCAHQGSRFTTEAEREKFFQWNFALEHETNRIPQADSAIVLRMPPAIAQRFVAAKAPRAHLGEKTHDLHEDSIDHLTLADAVYEQLLKLYPGTCVPIHCTEGDHVLDPARIHDKIWDHVMTLVR